jgi:hypothetical protein
MGRSKSGTSALAHAVLDSMPAPRTMLFEPREVAAAWKAPVGSVVAKLLIDPWWFDWSGYRDAERKVFIVRDPRDIIISKVLYHCYELAARAELNEKVERYIALVEEKERDPGRVPMQRVLGVWADLCGVSVPSPEDWGYDLAGWVVEFLDANPSLATVTYEDFVAKRYGAIEACLGFPLTGPARVPEELSRVSRSNASGSWRHWFVPEDVAYFRPVLAPHLDRLGYGEDWALADPQRILPEHASLYMRRIVKNRRDLMARDSTIWGPTANRRWMKQQTPPPSG